MLVVEASFISMSSIDDIGITQFNHVEIADYVVYSTEQHACFFPEVSSKVIQSVTDFPRRYHTVLAYDVFDIVVDFVLSPLYCIGLCVIICNEAGYGCFVFLKQRPENLIGVYLYYSSG